MNQHATEPDILAPYGEGIRLAAAQRVMHSAEAEAAKNGWPMVIAIVDSGANLVMLHKQDNAQLGSVQIAICKAETAVRFRRPTSMFQESLATGGAGLRMLSAPNVTMLAGGIPLIDNGVVVGAIGVSGMQWIDDVVVATAGARACRGRDGLSQR